MTTLTFLGFPVIYQPPRVMSQPDHHHLVQYRGLSDVFHSAIAQKTPKKGLKFRDVAY